MELYNRWQAYQRYSLRSVYTYFSCCWKLSIVVLCFILIYQILITVRSTSQSFSSIDKASVGQTFVSITKPNHLIRYRVSQPLLVGYYRQWNCGSRACIDYRLPFTVLCWRQWRSIAKSVLIHSF